MQLKIQINDDKELRDFIKDQIVQVMKTQIREEIAAVVKGELSAKIEKHAEQYVQWLMKQAGYHDFKGEATDKVKSALYSMLREKMAAEFDTLIKEAIAKEDWTGYAHIESLLTNAVNRKVDSLTTLLSKPQ